MIKKAIFIGLLGCLAYFLASTLMLFGFHLHYYKHHPGTCKVLDTKGFGSEDIQVTSNGQAFITSGIALPAQSPKYTEFLKKNNIKGRILLYNFNNAKLGVTELKVKTSGTSGLDLNTFRPHGISVFEDKIKGEHLVYVVNHPHLEPDVIEKFRFNPKTNELLHLKSIKDEMLTLTNDLAVVSEDNFYISNWLYFRNHLGVLADTLFGFPLSGILHFNGTGFSEVASGLVQPNGVHLSKDNKFVYVAMCITRAIWVYQRKEDNSLVLVQQVPVHTIVDNLHVSQDGKSLYAGCHPVGYKVMAAMDDPGSKRAPSQVLKFPLKDGYIQEEEATEMFYDQGALISASTVGVVYENSLLIGSLIDNLVICEPDGQLH